MKRISLVIIISVFIGFAGQALNAQNLKFGHINTGELIQTLPEFDTASAQLDRFRRDLVNALELMQVELNNKSDVYNRESRNYSDVVRQTKEQELMDMNRRIQEFQQTAQVQLTDKQSELFQPIVAKVDQAVKDVGKENGFIYIFMLGEGSTVQYFDETKSIDVMPLTKTKLGVK
ncbi:MAG: OmpH family outer membrane protein [Bacteroidales bacterium]|jgi:outer membrane protein|nr:OmpH family outer membrane protein [Bacteroidales bacterium]